jgi:hypothetical protein
MVLLFNRGYRLQYNGNFHYQQYQQPTQTLQIRPSPCLPLIIIPMVKNQDSNSTKWYRQSIRRIPTYFQASFSQKVKTFFCIFLPMDHSRLWSIYQWAYFIELRKIICEILTLFNYFLQAKRQDANCDENRQKRLMEIDWNFYWRRIPNETNDHRRQKSIKFINKNREFLSAQESIRAKSPQVTFLTELFKSYSVTQSNPTFFWKNLFFTSFQS